MNNASQKKLRVLALVAILAITVCALSNQIDAATSEGSKGRAEITINDTGALPENLTSSQDGTVFFGSMSKGTIYRAVPGSAQADAWIEGSEVGLESVLGVLADEKSNTLWVRPLHERRTRR